jgi:hypothetical protein
LIHKASRSSGRDLWVAVGAVGCGTHVVVLGHGTVMVLLSNFDFLNRVTVGIVRLFCDICDGGVVWIRGLFGAVI